MALATRPAAAWTVAAAALVAATLAFAGASRAESAWVKDDLRLNLRTGPGVSYRIVGSVETGDMADVLERHEGWTKIRVHGTDEGWIPAGYLEDEMPAKLRVAKWEAETTELRERVAELTREAERLRDESEMLTGQDEAQRQEIAQLTQENVELSAGPRWPDRVAGAAILCAGMLLGAWLQRRAGRRATPKIRL